MAFPSRFLLFFYFIGFSPTIACVPTVTWHCTMAELFQKTSGASVTSLEVNNHKNDDASDTCMRCPSHSLSTPISCTLSPIFTHPICSIQVYKQQIPALFPLSFLAKAFVNLFTQMPFPFLWSHRSFCELRDNNCHTFLTLFLMLLRSPSPPSYEHRPPLWAKTHLAGAGLRV